MSIDRDEHKILVDYFTAANIKMKTVDVKGVRQDLKETGKSNQDEDMAAEYDDEEGSEDESFNEEGNDEEGSDENGSDDGSDESMEDVDKQEVKALQKEVGDVNMKEGRSKRKK